MYYLAKQLGRAAKRLLGLPTFPPSRYRHLYDEIARTPPSRILEVGTNDGLNAVEMARVARRSGATRIDYYGFDLFEAMDQARLIQEFAIRARSHGEVSALLRRSGFTVAQLFAGDTRVTLPAAARTLPTMDLIFIDGGHSYETVLSDWESVAPLVGPETSVIFDDYPSFGVGRVVDEIDRGQWDVEVLPTVDRFTGPHADSTLAVQLVRARRASAR